ncbi:MAG TPA: hypothetical protein VKA46_00235 [Gemmataceae bacterium]|nr:hypothetical protein [Gemmataceae bacterium]
MPACTPNLPSPGVVEPIIRIAAGVFLPPGGEGGFPYVATASENDVLGAFLRHSAMTLEELKDVSGRTHAHKVLARLRQKAGGAFAPAIHLPGRRGNGGYAVMIEEAKPAATTAVQNRPRDGPLSMPPRGEEFQS